jgi:L-asparaginase II
VAQTQVRASSRASARAPVRTGRYPRHAAPPVLVEVRRGNVVESRHRGHIVQVNEAGRIERGIGDPHLLVNLRSSVKPFALIALVESGAVEAFKVSDPELAVMAASHTGEDAHVRTLQAIFRRASLSQSLLACGTEGAPQDQLTAARLARDGEEPSPVRHMCSGFHTASLLLSRHRGWSLADYWRPDHPSQVAIREVVSAVFGVAPNALRTSVDSCGVHTYAFPLADVARAFGLLAEPNGTYAASLTRIRDAMMAAPEMVGGSRDSSDTQLMKARRGAMVMKGGAESLRGIGLLPSARGHNSTPAGVALKIDDGDPNGRANRAVTVEALAQLGVLDAAALERLADLHRPPMFDPRGIEVGKCVPSFELAPLSELAS